ncbi:hypothetical protein GF336_02615 [Candidatus Woesearchaeota archaeon]|nr:hypothetical protein [Candidatus Woesearchaeota archaeon]
MKKGRLLPIFLLIAVLFYAANAAAANVSITKTALNNPVETGGTAQFIINVTNIGASDLTGYHIYDSYYRIPEGNLDFENETSLAYDYYNESENEIKWYINLTAGESKVIYINFTVTGTGDAWNSAEFRNSSQYTFAEDNTSITISDTTDPVLNYNSSDSSVDIGDTINIATNWTDTSLDTENLICQLYVGGSLNETKNSTDSWCNFTYTTASANYPSVSFYVTAIDGSGNTASSSTLTSTVNLACGNVITSDFTLTQNLDCSAVDSDGLVIEKDNIVIDCSDKTIYGNNSDGGSNIGIDSNGYDNLIIQDCSITGFDKGIRIYNSIGHQITGNNLTSNVDVAFSALHLENVNNSLIQSNDIIENDNGIYLKDSYNNRIDSNTVFNNTQKGIYLEDSDNNNITSNTIKHNTDAGIYFDTSSSNYIHDNTVWYNDADPLDAGVYIKFNSNYNRIDDNDISYNNNNGIILSGAYHNNITNNIVKNNQKTGIFIYNSVSADTLIQGNTIKDNLGEGIVPPAECGIDIYASDDIDVLNNTISNNNPYGMHFQPGGEADPATITIANNTLSIKLNNPEEGYTLNQSNLYENFTYDWSNFLPYALDSTGNCTLYVDGTVKNITSFTDKGTDNLGTTNTVENISIQYKTQTWYVSCEDDNGNTAESERKTLTTSSLQSQAANIPITTTANTETDVNQTELSNNNISANISLMTGVSTTGTMTVSQYEDNPAPSTSGFSTPIGLFMSFDLNMSGLDWAIIKMYYSDSDVSGLDESTLRISYYNATSGIWSSYDPPNGGVNTSANYVWANTTHFSIFGASGISSSSDTTSTGGGSGGSRYTYQESTLYNSLTVKGMHRYYIVKFSLEGQSHNIRPDMIASDRVKFKTFSSDPLYTTVYLGETGLVDVDGDGEDDLSITVNSISGDSADVSFRFVEELQQTEPIDIQEPETQPAPEPETEEEISEEDVPEEEKEKIVEMEDTNWTAYIIAAIALLAVLAFVFFKKKNSPQH